MPRVLRRRAAGAGRAGAPGRDDRPDVIRLAGALDGVSDAEGRA